MYKVSSKIKKTRTIAIYRDKKIESMDFVKLAVGFLQKKGALLTAN